MFAIPAETIPGRHNPQDNHLIAALPATDYERLLPHLELAPLPLGWVVYEAGGVLGFAISTPAVQQPGLSFRNALRFAQSAGFWAGGPLQNHGHRANEAMPRFLRRWQHPRGTRMICTASYRRDSSSVIRSGMSG